MIGQNSINTVQTEVSPTITTRKNYRVQKQLFGNPISEDDEIIKSLSFSKQSKLVKAQAGTSRDIQVNVKCA